MNRQEWLKSTHKRGSLYRQVHQLLKDWKIENNITERCVVHHRDDTEEARVYNEAHYELWGFEIDENNNLNFKLGKYVQFMTRAEHAAHHNTGKIVSSETRIKISQNHADFSGENNPMYGKTHSDESKTKMKESHKGCLSPMHDKTHSDEARAKMSNTRKGHKLSVETKEKLCIANKGENNPNYGKKFSDETKAKMSATKKAVGILWNVYKNNNGLLSYAEFRKAVKNGEITFEAQPITIFIK